MGLRINTNLAAMAATRALQSSSGEQAKSYQRLASGDRLTSSGDDAAGLSISEKLKSEIRGLQQAERNTNDSISFVQVAEGGLNDIGNVLTRLRELAIQASSDTIGDRERGFVDKEVQSLKAEAERIAQVTNYNGTHLLNGESDHDMRFQIGLRKEDSIVFNPAELKVTNDELGISGFDYRTVDGAKDSLDQIDKAIDKVSAARAGLGANQNKLQMTVGSLATLRENYSAANSRIRDTDYAVESSKLAAGNIKQQAGISILTQANTANQAALRLVS